MIEIKGEKTKEKCLIKVCELYPVYRKLICSIFDKKEYKFTKTQQLIVMTLWLYKTLSLSELSEKICTSNEQATRAVGQLVKQGCVTRTKNESNRRSIEISLTQKAIDAILEAQSKAAERIPESLDRISEEDAATILDCLNKIGDIVIKLNVSPKR